MREINTAFETLRHSVPQAITSEDAANASEKLTKITTLRLAMKYIQMLSDSMEDPSYEREFIGECLEESANREALISVDTEPELEVELPVPAAAAAAAAKKTAKSKAASKKSATAASKRQTQKQAKQGHPTQTTISAMSSGESCYAASSIGSPGSCAGAACSPSSAYASLSSSASNISSSQRSPSSSQRSSSSPVLEPDGSLMGLQGLSELDTLLLESDAESLQCLSPGYEGLLSSGESLLPCRGDMPLPGCLDKPDVELSLRMLDAQHSTDSFDFASDQQPSACISALDALDGCYPWGPGDLLHGDFSDIFLT
ncbi:helix-loop-helix protein delilah isoform X2 [Drosophila guanche]|nr:helix-loop-helix protein delilah isoform X2 [Drosophila guanche]